MLVLRITSRTNKFRPDLLASIISPWTTKDLGFSEGIVPFIQGAECEDECVSLHGREAYEAWPDLHQRKHLSVTHLGVGWDGVGAMACGG